MAKIGVNGTLRELKVLFGVGATAEMTDGELLEKFSLNQGETGELAFEALVQRHGSMVNRTCRALLNDPNDADDAFQATFLVLARKADSLWVTGTIAPWLHGVACRIATRVLSDRARRQRHEQRVARPVTTTSTNGLDAVDRADLNPVLHEEIERLPERFRTPLILCYLGGLTHDQAAHQLGWPVGTVRSRLARGRDRLRGALDRRGVAPSCGLPTLGLAAHHVRTSLVDSAVRAATWTAMGNASIVEVGPAVSGLSKGVLTAMAINKLSRIAAGLLVSALLASGAAAYTAREARSGEDPQPLVPNRSSPRPGPSTSSRPARPQAPARSEAETLAERILEHGSKLFNARNSAGLAATYAEEGTIRLMGKEGDQPREETRRGRPEVERFYRDYFRESHPVGAKNFVDYAQFVTPDLLIIHGRFSPDQGKRGLPFVQMRRKQNDEWLVDTLWLFVEPGDR